MPLFRHRPLLYACLSPNMNITSEPLTQTDLSHHFASLTELLYREKRVIFVLLLSVLFLVQCFQTDWKAAVFVCVCVFECMSGYVYIYKCMWVCCRLCVLMMKGSTFFLTRRCEDNLRSLFLTCSHMGA